MEQVQMKKIYITAKLKADKKLCRVRNEIYDRVGGIRYYKKVSPHITVIPPFYIDKTKVSEVNKLVDQSGIVGKNVEYTNLMVWESLNNPEYVMLSAKVDMWDTQVMLLDSLADMGATHLKTPVPPHTTLFKSNHMWEVPTTPLKANIQSCIGDYTDIEDTTISEVRPIMD